MIEEVQDAINTVLKNYLEANLALERAPSGGVRLPMIAPRKYTINYDTDQTFLTQDQLPAFIQIPEKTPPDHTLQGYHTYWNHKIRLALVLEQVHTGDALEACEALQRQRSRYARAIIRTLWEHQQDSVMVKITLDDILYSKMMHSAEESRFVGSVWLYVTVKEKEEL